MTRKEVVAEALSWEGTPYHHRARVRGAGVDCANLPAAVYEAVGLIPHIDPEYSTQWMMHRDEEKFLEWVRPYATEIEWEKVGPGDLLVYKFGRTFSHSVLMLEPPLGLHAAVIDGAVVRTDVSKEAMFLDRPFLCFTLWG